MFLFNEYIESSKLIMSIDNAIVVDSVTDFEDKPTEEDYTALAKKISAMKPTTAENDVLNCYMSGFGHCATASLLGINRTTVWKRRQKVMKKYMDAFC